MRKLWGLGLLVVVGCANENVVAPETVDSGVAMEQDAARKCPLLTGSYNVTFAKRSGTCGDITERVVYLGTPDAAAGCSGPTNVSDDLCSASYDLTCSIPSPPGTIREIGTEHVEPDMVSVRATEQITISDSTGKVVCLGTYDVSYTKL